MDDLRSVSPDSGSGRVWQEKCHCYAVGSDLGDVRSEGERDIARHCTTGSRPV